MKFRTQVKKLEAPGKWTVFLALVLGSSFVNRVLPSSPIEGALQYEIGCPIPWLNVYSTQSGEWSVLNLLFNGNEGIWINPLGLLVYVLLALVLGVLVQWIFNRFWPRSCAEKPKKVRKQGFWYVTGELCRFLKKPGWIAAAADWVLTICFSFITRVDPPLVAGNVYQYSVGNWMTIHSYEGGYQVWDSAWNLLFNGNAGVSLNPIYFFTNYLLVGLAVGGLVQFLINWLQKRKQKNPISGALPTA